MKPFKLHMLKFDEEIYSHILWNSSFRTHKLAASMLYEESFLCAWLHAEWFSILFRLATVKAENIIWKTIICFTAANRRKAICVHTNSLSFVLKEFITQNTASWISNKGHRIYQILADTMEKLLSSLVFQKFPFVPRVRLEGGSPSHTVRTDLDAAASKFVIYLVISWGELNRTSEQLVL